MPQLDWNSGFDYVTLSAKGFTNNMVSKRILIVEDDRKSLYALTAVLEQQGHHVKGFSEPGEVNVIPDGV